MNSITIFTIESNVFVAEQVENVVVQLLFLFVFLIKNAQNLNHLRSRLPWVAARLVMTLHFMIRATPWTSDAVIRAARCSRFIKDIISAIYCNLAKKIICAHCKNVCWIIKILSHTFPRIVPSHDVPKYFSDIPYCSTDILMATHSLLSPRPSSLTPGAC